MGWQSHVSDKIAAGQVVRFPPHTMPSTDGHYLFVKNQRKSLPVIKSLIKWLQEESRPWQCQ